MSKVETDYIENEAVTSAKIATLAKNEATWNANKIQGTTINAIGAGGTHPVYNSNTDSIEWDNINSEPTGFPNRTDSVVSFVDGSHTFTIEPTGSSYDVYIKGNKYTKTSAENVIIDDTEGDWFIYFNSAGVLVASQTPWSLDIHAPTALILWDADNKKALQICEERHGLAMSWYTHYYLHSTRGTWAGEGLDLTDYITNGSGASNTDIQVGVSNGNIFDEDIEINIVDGAGSAIFEQELSPIAYMPIFYKLGSTPVYRKQDAVNVPLLYDVGGRPKYNLLSGGSWSLQEASDKHYIAMWVIASSDINDPMLTVLGQNESSTLSGAIQLNLFDDLEYDDIPFTEYRVMYRLIYYTDSTFTNSAKSALRHVQRIAPVNKSNPVDDIFVSKAVSAFIDQSFYNAHLGTEYVEIVSTSYETIANFIYPGSAVATINELKLILSRKAGIGTSTVRIYDYTNNNVITSIGYTGTDKDIYVTSDIVNLPTGQAIFEVQAVTTNIPSATRIHFLKVI